MRDIRSDLQERANLIEEQIRAACAHFEKMVQQLQGERDADVAELKSSLAWIGKFMEAEHRRMSDVLTLTNPPGAAAALARRQAQKGRAWPGSCLRLVLECFARNAGNPRRSRHSRDTRGRRPSGRHSSCSPMEAAMSQRLLISVRRFCAGGSDGRCFPGSVCQDERHLVRMLIRGVDHRSL